MEAYRERYTVKNNKLIINLPDDFNDTEVDVIVLPSDNRDWYDDTTESEKKSIAKGKQDFEAMRITPHKEVAKEIRELIGNRKQTE